jgi:hypothetical protein
MDAGALSRWWLVLTAPALVGGMALIGLCVALLLRTVRQREFARLPLSATQEFDLPEAGPVGFLVDQPRLRGMQPSLFNPSALSVSLEDKAGRIMPVTRALAPISIKGLARRRTELANLAEAAAGRYRVHVAGVPADSECAGSFLVVARPIPKLTFVLGILAIIASSAMAVGGLIGSIATFVPFHRG